MLSLRRYQNRIVGRGQPRGRSRMGEANGWTPVLLPRGIGIWRPCDEHCEPDCEGVTVNHVNYSPLFEPGRDRR